MKNCNEMNYTWSQNLFNCRGNNNLDVKPWQKIMKNCNPTYSKSYTTTFETKQPIKYLKTVLSPDNYYKPSMY